MKVILASNSPRRRELLKQLGVDFEVKVLENVNEAYPETLHPIDVAEYIACEKASAYNIGAEELLITADTVVVVENHILGKPKDDSEAHSMLRELSGRTHQVITGVCLKTMSEKCQFSVSTDVTFKNLTEEEIDFYIKKYSPYDKAGAYGIQEWIGYIGVISINGSFYNVMGFPVQRVYEELSSRFGIKILK